MSFQLTEKGTYAALIVALALGAAVGMTTGWALWRPKTVVERIEPAKPLPNGGLVLAKQPDAEAKPAQQIPANAVVERIVYVEIQPKPKPLGPSGAAIPPIPGASATAPPPQPSLPLPEKLRVDLTLYRNPDGTKRVAVSSPDGEILGGMDIPVEAAKPVPKVLKWCAGAVYGQTVYGDKSVGAFVDRDVAFVRVGVEVTKNTYALPSKVGWEARVRCGIRF